MTSDDDNPTEFERLIPGVKRLHHDRINVYQHRPVKTRVTPPSPGFTAGQEAQAMSGSAPAQALYFNTGLQKKLQRRIRQGLIRPEASLDLHGYRQGEALDALEAFISDAHGAGMRMLIIIHGQGYRSHQEAVLKPLVQRWLSRRAEVLAWCPAQPRDGAGGASYVYLRGG